MGCRRKFFRPRVRSIVRIHRLQFRDHALLVVGDSGQQRHTALDRRWRSDIRSRVKWQLERHVQVTILQDKATLMSFSMSTRPRHLNLFAGECLSTRGWTWTGGGVAIAVGLIEERDARQN
jgi:hypothetical protein